MAIPAGKARLIVTETIYHQAADLAGTSKGRPFSRFLTSDEQPYCRPMNLTEDWATIDVGWIIGPAGMLRIANEGTETIEVTVLPSEPVSEMKPPRAIVVPQWLVPPGESGRMMPVNVHMVRIRSRAGECRASVTVYPS